MDCKWPTPLSNLAVKMWKWCCNRAIFVRSSNDTLVGNEVNLVFGQYADSSSDHTDDKRMFSNSVGATIVTWFHHQLEECAQPNSEDRISGFSD